jgi:zinc protease
MALLLTSCGNMVKTKPNDNKFAGSLSELNLKLDVKKRTLSNGMKVLISENHKLPIFSIYTYYDVGGRYEYPGTTGSTHFLEHMLFKKTKNNPAGTFSKFIESNGGNSNAYTTFDNTVYYENVPSYTIEEIINLEAERMANLELVPEAFEKERQVVLEERKMRYENSPRGLIYQTMMKTMFKGTPYGGSVIGDAKDVKNLSREKMMEFYKDFYAPNNAIMIIVGDVKAEAVFDYLEAKIGKIPANKELDALKAKLDHKDRYNSKAKLPVVRKVHGQSATPMFTLSFPAPGVGTEDGYALDFLSSILGTGASSFLNQTFVTNRRPKLQSIYAANYTLKNSGVFFLQGQLLDKVNINKFRRSLMKSLKKSCYEAVTERNVQKTKNILLVNYYSNIQTNAGLASFLGSNEFFYGDYKKYEEELAIYNSMNVKKVRAVCEKYLNPKKSAFVSVWKKHKKRK